MRIFICDAFSSEIFKGNQAGVVILEEKEEYPTVTLMKNIAAELKHSETAFVKKIDNKNLKLDTLLQQKRLNYVDMQQFQFFCFKRIKINI